LFNVLQNNLDISTLKTLDLFGGTGCISYELMSRGVVEATLVEKDTAMFEFIRKTAQSLGCPIRLVKSDVFKYIETCSEQFDFVFAGPPYALDTIDDLPIQIFRHQLLRPGGWFVLEHTPRNDYAHFEHFKAARKYGTTVFSIFIN